MKPCYGFNTPWKETFDHLTKAQANQKNYYDKRTSKRTFNEGDLVMCHDTTATKTENNKLTHSWRGPFVIFKIISPTNVLIKKTPTSKLFNVHVNRLKIYNPFDLFKEGSPSGYLNSPPWGGRDRRISRRFRRQWINRQ